MIPEKFFVKISHTKHLGQKALAVSIAGITGTTRFNFDDEKSYKEACKSVSKYIKDFLINYNEKTVEKD